MPEVTCLSCGFRQGVSNCRCVKCEAQLPKEAPAGRRAPWATESSTDQDRELQRKQRGVPSRRAAWTGLGIVAASLIASGTALVLKSHGIIAPAVAEEIAVISLTATFFLGIPFLLVPIIAFVAAALQRRQKLSSALYRLLMFVVGIGFVASCIYMFGIADYGRAMGAGMIAIWCLWYGAVRGENPVVT